MIGRFIASAWKWLDRFADGLEKIGSYVLVGMVLLTTSDIISRRFFNSPFPFTYEVTEYLLVVVAWCYIAFTTSKGRHVSVDTLTSRFPPRLRNNILVIGDFITIIFLGLISWQNILQARNVQELGTTSAIMHIPKYPFQFWVAIAAALACLMFLAKTLHALLGRQEKAAGPAGEGKTQ